MDESNDDPRLPHHRNPKEYVSVDTLAGQSPLSLYLFLSLRYLSGCMRVISWETQIAEIGVLHWKLNAKDYENDPELRKIREERAYNYMVSFVSGFLLFNLSNCLLSAS